MPQHSWKNKPNCSQIRNKNHKDETRHWTQPPKTSEQYYWWCAGSCFPTTWSPLFSLSYFLFYSPDGMLYGSASIGWGRAHTKTAIVLTLFAVFCRPLCWIHVPGVEFNVSLVCWILIVNLMACYFVFLRVLWHVDQWFPGCGVGCFLYGCCS